MRAAAPAGAGAGSPRVPVRVLRRLRIFLAPYRGRVVLALIALIVAAGTVLGFGAGLRWLVDNGFAGGNRALLDRALIALFGIVALLAVASWARSYYVSWIGERVAADLRKAVFDHVIELSPAFFEVTRTGEVISRLTTDTTLLQTVVGTSASMAIRNILLVIGGAAMMIVTSPKLTALVALVLPLVVVPIVVFGRRVRRLSRASQDRIGDVGAHVEETLNAIRTVQAFVHEDADRRQFGARVEDAFRVAVHRSSLRATMAAFVILLVFSAVGTILWVGGRSMLAGDLSAGQLSAFVFYAVLVAGSVGAISEFASDLQRAAGASERLFELLDARPAIAPPAVRETLPEPARGTVSFRDIVFSYPSRPDHPALEHFDLTVAPGETVALVGPSGAGKTTVFQLLLRFYDVQSGRIELDGIDVRRLDPRAVRQRVCLVPQEPVIFAASVLDNIRYGRPEASEAEVRAAADAAAASEFIDRLPDGFGSFLGERGVRLSGGQRQRVAIARAILCNPAVLLLDEATSALDSESERLVQAALERLMVGRTTLVIAHRLSTVLKADRITVLDRGRIEAVGRHGELLAAGGLYARLAALQFDAGRLGADETTPRAERRSV
ncbi:MAG: ABC transporter transmembrane domain-containing protein [Alphaproteobacteria bacterium]